jgi:Right handed beta helix region
MAPAASRRTYRGLLALAVVLATVAGIGLFGQWPQRAGTGTSAGDPRMAPCSGIAIGPRDSLQAAIDAHPQGTTFCLEAGMHRLAQAVPKDYQRFIGEGAGTTLSGARVLRADDAKRGDDGRYYWKNQTQESKPHGTLLGPGYSEESNLGDLLNEELFVTPSEDPADPPIRYQRVVSLSELGPERWFFDYGRDRIYVTDDPARLGLIETSVLPAAIASPPEAPVRGVVIEDLVVEKYASVAQQAAVGGTRAFDWTIRSITVRYNHGAGVELGPGTLMENCKIHHMGQEGLLGGGNATTRPTVLRNTEVAYNKTLSFDADWDAGGAKFTRAFGRGMLVENSWFHHNRGAGLWFDIDNYDVVIRSNRFEANDRWGVHYEVSRQAEIYWNEVFDTTDGPEDFLFNGTGIFVTNSAEVDVYENLVYDNKNGILVKEDRQATRWAQDSFREGLPHVERVSVHDNDLRMLRGFTGMRLERGDARGYWRPSHIRFAGNTYRLGGEGRFLGPGNDVYTVDEWRDLGNDRTGTVHSAASDGSLPPRARTFAMSAYGAQP